MILEPHHEHKTTAPSRARFAVLTVSDSRSSSSDASGALIERVLRDAGHEVVLRELVRDEAKDIRAAVESFLRADAVDAVVTTGGTGIAPRDVTIEALAPLFERRLPGFGELFRALSFQEIGSSAMLSRSDAGIAGGKPVFVLPGSPKACELALVRLIVPEVGHILSLLRR